MMRHEKISFFFLSLKKQILAFQFLMELIILNAHTTAASVHSSGGDREGKELARRERKKRRQKITIKIEVERKTIK